MWNATLWTLIACASLCTAGSILVPPYQCRMWRVDSDELRRRRLMVAVLKNNTRTPEGDPAVEGPSPDAHLVG
ncbi:hypothetical protein ACFPC0_13080 [Streptomyces andamanensis]|uniref:Uncharacterized protein n=1 Tax=Streptomyces andamanensis TaxID=1565035 RepID=A0ABV8TDQ0_9ACTN|nr:MULTISPECIES: hypothetical protein [unclassified Streptomyces]EYT79884.1 hypothetical protein CF54_28665 [Streptomyces sp. Tu 6176]